MRPASTETDLVKWVPVAYAGERSKSEGKLILYDFTAAWCGPCHVLDEEVFQDPTLAARINERFIPVRVVDRMQEDGRNIPVVATMQSQFGVSAFPTVVVTNANGSVLKKMVGYSGKEEYAEMIEQVR
jgi:uncharacterized protein YyaL (SSP411 family)